MAAADALLVEIARCPNVPLCFTSTAMPHPCSRVVAAQRSSLEDVHVPEPWSGRIETAPILFVSWNPSWNRNEHFPTLSWNDGEMVEFFRSRFEHTDQASQTWREMRGIAEHLLGRPPRPGIDYAVTDVVRCKSQKGEGAREALNECTARYLRRTMAVSAAHVIVALGKDARETLARFFGVPPEIGAHGPNVLNRRERILVLLGAPGSSQPRRLSAHELSRVRRALT